MKARSFHALYHQLSLLTHFLLAGFHKIMLAHHWRSFFYRYDPSKWNPECNFSAVPEKPCSINSSLSISLRKPELTRSTMDPHLFERYCVFPVPCTNSRIAHG